MPDLGFCLSGGWEGGEGSIMDVDTAAIRRAGDVMIYHVRLVLRSSSLKVSIPRAATNLHEAI